MIDKATAARLTYRQELYHVSLRGSDRRAVRCRVNGKLKTWKTRPSDYRLPVKYGLRDCFYITPENADEWTTEEPDYSAA